MSLKENISTNDRLGWVGNKLVLSTGEQDGSGSIWIMNDLFMNKLASCPFTFELHPKELDIHAYIYVYIVFLIEEKAVFLIWI